ncbi:hypothetical protein OG21DRAFT_1600604 [Imleria badia]|nr:hypothetical protein OG21DRAFT_1600604 [Imleria badia]
MTAKSTIPAANSESRTVTLSMSNPPPKRLNSSHYSKKAGTPPDPAASTCSMSLTTPSSRTVPKQEHPRAIAKTMVAAQRVSVSHTSDLAQRQVAREPARETGRTGQMRIRCSRWQISSRRRKKLFIS